MHNINIWAVFIQTSEHIRAQDSKMTTVYIKALNLWTLSQWCNKILHKHTLVSIFSCTMVSHSDFIWDGWQWSEHYTQHNYILVDTTTTTTIISQYLLESSSSSDFLLLFLLCLFGDLDLLRWWWNFLLCDLSLYSFTVSVLFSIMNKEHFKLSLYTYALNKLTSPQITAVYN